MPPKAALKKARSLTLAPAQAKAFRFIEHALGFHPFVGFWGRSGMGKTTVLRQLQEKLGGVLLTAADFVDAAQGGAPDGLEESFHRALVKALRKNELVFVDDLSQLDFQSSACGGYPRVHWWNAVFESVVTEAERLERRLVVASSGRIPHHFTQRAYAYGIAKFEAADYAALLESFLGALGTKLDAKRVFRFAPNLDLHDFRKACKWMKQTRRKFDTEQFIEYLRSQSLASNVNLSEVQAVDLHSLIGVDDVIRSLETYIVMPLENDQMAAKLGLRPKRGVLLHGPPGTGKTTVGRALAHRLRGKFFLIDGTFIAGSQHFYSRVHEVFEAAKQNAPAVIFVDDADAIFQNNEEQGLYRYLLTMLDGLESEGHAQVCVMMTAMNLGDLPPALVRSGRVELWLGMKLPDLAARQSILELHVKGLPAALAGVDLPALAAATDGLTGADLKRCVEDTKSIYAFAELKKEPRATAGDYFQEAIATIRANKELYRDAQQSAQGPRSSGMPGFPGLPPGFAIPPQVREMIARMQGNGGGQPDASSIDVGVFNSE